MQRGHVVAVLALAVLAPVVSITAAGAVPSGGADAAAAQTERPNPCVRTVAEEPDAPTLMSIQGARGRDKTVAMVAGLRPNGEVIGIHNASANGRWWAYDVDPLANGNLLLSSTEPGISVVEEIDPETGDHEAVRRFPDVLDSHDADLINGDELLMNDMSDGEDRVIVYNLTREEVVWEYDFHEHTDVFDPDNGGEYEKDWTHNNDVEKIGDGQFMVSVRNHDQVVAINRSTKELAWRLGSDDNRSVMFEQHNPDYLEDEQGRATVLIADSRNDRVVEYTREDGEWNQTWTMNGGGLNEPRDADRLPNGNTLIADRRGDRIVEVTPDGEVVWEVLSPWQPYDVERIGTGDESMGPTMLEADATGDYQLNSTSVEPDALEACYSYLTDVESTQLLPADATPTGDDGTTDGSDGGETTSPGDGETASPGGGGPDGGDGETADGSDGETDRSDGESVLGDGGSDETTTGATGPGFGPVAALLAVVFAATLRRR
jgi:hypothetical protein